MEMIEWRVQMNEETSRLSIHYHTKSLVLGFVQPDAAINLRQAIETAVGNGSDFVSMDLDSKRMVIFVKNILWMTEEYLGVSK